MRRISAERTMKNMTQTDLAKKMKVDQRTVRRWELNETGIPSEVILELADFFGCSTDWLFGRTERRNWDSK